MASQINGKPFSENFQNKFQISYLKFKKSADE
jgi:hypothetical protein